VKLLGKNSEAEKNLSSKQIQLQVEEIQNLIQVEKIPKKKKGARKGIISSFQ